MKQDSDMKSFSRAIKVFHTSIVIAVAKFFAPHFVESVQLILRTSIMTGDSFPSHSKIFFGIEKKYFSMSTLQYEIGSSYGFNSRVSLYSY